MVRVPYEVKVANKNNQMVERLLLAHMLTYFPAVKAVAESGVTADDFYEINYRLLARIILDYYEETGEHADFAVTAKKAQEQGIWDRIGGQALFADVLAPAQPELGELSVATLGYHIKALREYSNRRKLYEAGYKIASAAFDISKTLPEMLDTFERLWLQTIERISKTTQTTITFPEAVKTSMERIEWARAQDSDSFLGYKSGYSDFDEIVGAFAPGTLNILAARPSMGKSALALNFIFRGEASDPQLPVLLFSLEMNIESIVHRFLSMATKISLMKIRRAILNDTELSLLWTMARSLENMNLIVEDSSDLTTMKFRSLCRRYKQQHKGIGLIVVDYLQLLTTGKDYHGNRVNEVSEISKELKAAAVELDCPVIALSQLSRETEKRNDKKPKMSDLRDSGSIEQDADTVTLLYREDYYNDEDKSKKKKDTVLDLLDDVAELNVAKNRNGPVGICKLLFHREYTSFEAMN